MTDRTTRRKHWEMNVQERKSMVMRIIMQTAEEDGNRKSKANDSSYQPTPHSYKKSVMCK